MKILVIPDVHLKPWMFEQAEMVDTSKYDNIVILGDLVDDWGKTHEPELYEDLLKCALEFAKSYPQSLWCYGNHDLSYLYDYPDTGYSIFARSAALDGLEALETELQDRLKVIHKIDTVLFSHAGLTLDFVQQRCARFHDDFDTMLQYINDMPKSYQSCNKLRDNSSPIWARLTNDTIMYPAKYLQIVGHTPVPEGVLLDNNTFMLDTFSTTSAGQSYGNETLYIVDTITHDIQPAY